MSHQSLDKYLINKFGFDQYAVLNHVDSNRAEIERSDKCCCYFCQSEFPPSEIVAWVDDECTARCPKCGLASVVLGSASGIPFDKEYLELVASWYAGA
jgi:hypothetical protein